jgi:hypothetical protein
MTAVNWMPKYYKRKYHNNPNDPDISISTQHTDRKGFFMYNISRKYPNQQIIFQYSKSTKT